MENYTFNSLTLRVEQLMTNEDSVYPIFFFFLFSFVFIMVANIGILILVFMDKNLHQPMYFLFCNLPINDILGASAVLPRLVIDILKPPSKLFISYNECVVQVFAVHIFWTASHTALIAMAFDRYVAICKPLRYSTIMTNKMVIKLSALTWGIPFVFVGVLVGLTVRLNRCRTLITNPYCDNASLFKLSCEDLTINNIYGLTFTIAVLTFSIGCIVLTYGKITAVCLTSNSKTLNSKALKTCTTHLFLYVVMYFCGLLVVTLHRFPQYALERKLFAILLHILPGSLNPIIYGVQSAEMQKLLSKLFCPRKIQAF